MPALFNLHSKTLKQLQYEIDFFILSQNMQTPKERELIAYNCSMFQMSANSYLLLHIQIETTPGFIFEFSL